MVMGSDRSEMGSSSHRQLIEACCKASPPPPSQMNRLLEKAVTNRCSGCVLFSQPSDLRQELAVRERQQEVTRKSAPSSPTLDCEKMDSAVQASLSLPATPVGKGSENSFPSPKGIIHRNRVWLVGSMLRLLTISDQVLVSGLEVSVVMCRSHTCCVRCV